MQSYFSFAAVRPEMAIGLGVTREPIQLRRATQGTRVVGVANAKLDMTDKLRDYGERLAKELRNISGYIFKSRSPSCGMERV